MNTGKRINFLYKLVKAACRSNPVIRTYRCPATGRRLGITVETNPQDREQVRTAIRDGLLQRGWTLRDFERLERHTETGWQYMNIWNVGTPSVPRLYLSMSQFYSCRQR